MVNTMFIYYITSPPQGGGEVWLLSLIPLLIEEGLGVV